jgi:hypothetical protein
MLNWGNVLFTTHLPQFAHSYESILLTIYIGVGVGEIGLVLIKRHFIGNKKVHQNTATKSHC